MAETDTYDPPRIEERTELDGALMAPVGSGFVGV
jgi:hypothetical protein